MAFSIRCNESSLAKGGPLVTGEIWFDVDGVEFPSAGWNDFVVVVLSWWTQALLDLEAERAVDLSFMDGPWNARLALVTSELCDLRLYDGHGDEGDAPKELLRAPVFRKSVVENLVRVGRSVVARCEAAGWTSTDLDKLRANLERL